ncbi:pyridoxal phosphate-dependent decarboxylase family protein [Desertibaculum subflavum]|uniref:pyridoxal phosphate-dependent decarboxylase family protein n=1 Tax=Desertibaculum subflavum TaxID=2268458 RepID=UPI000E6737B5
MATDAASKRSRNGAPDSLGTGVETARPLDPADWAQFRELSHRALDEAIDRLATIETRPVWQPMPPEIRNSFESPMPRSERAFGEVLDEYRARIEPYATGNAHPLFMGWVHGAGTPVGMVAEMLAAGLNANCGGRDHVGLEVERQIARWAAELFGLPPDASGIFVTGTSMANFLGLLVARNAALGDSVRAEGLRAAPAQLVAYASEQAHGCISQALELAGIGSRHLRLVPVDAAGAIRLDRLDAAIAADRRAGLRPFLLVGTAGTVNTGAVDDLERLAGIAVRHQLWFHVDGAFGALAALSPRLRSRLAGIEHADSIAFDFHKWAHVPYDAGFLLVRDPDAHKRTFANPAAYLARAPEGLAAGETWPCDLGPDLSRGFRALKVWFTFQTFGADHIGAAIEHCCAVAQHLERRLRGSALFELAAPVGLNIVCWRVHGAADDGIHQAIAMELQKQGIAVPSLTTLDGRPALRAAIVNHRTDKRHIDAFVEAMSALAERKLRKSHLSA